MDTGFPPAYATDPDAAAKDNPGSFGHLVNFTAANTAKVSLPC